MSITRSTLPARIRLHALVATAALALMAGCASGPKYAEQAASMPSVKPGEGRIFFYRESSMVGAAMQPDIKLNDQVVGSSKPGGYFWIDRPAGQYVASSSTETEKTVSFALAPGETKYIRSTLQMGVMVGRVVLSVESPEVARPQLTSLSYTGVPAKP